VKQGAAAVFVKTPGVSAIKTRLSAGIGKSEAETFYDLSCQATREVLDGFCLMSHLQLTPYWAVAESASVSSRHWQDFPKIFQGEGGLGAKLHQVYSKLLEKYDYVLILGGDCPQVSREPLLRATDVLTEIPGFVLGKSYDGGFWLFGGNTPVPEAVWNNTPYSQANTAAVLEEALMKIAPVTPIQKLQDVDVVEDFRSLKRELLAQQILNRSQTAILNWLAARAS
jgi:glycosyltransferase A (GT-A) superfamily protein (DUF2064 family)